MRIVYEVYEVCCQCFEKQRVRLNTRRCNMRTRFGLLAMCLGTFFGLTSGEVCSASYYSDKWAWDMNPEFMQLLRDNPPTSAVIFADYKEETKFVPDRIGTGNGVTVSTTSEYNPDSTVNLATTSWVNPHPVSGYASGATQEGYGVHCSSFSISYENHPCWQGIGYPGWAYAPDRYSLFGPNRFDASGVFTASTGTGHYERGEYIYIELPDPTVVTGVYFNAWNDRKYQLPGIYNIYAGWIYPDETWPTWFLIHEETELDWSQRSSSITSATWPPLYDYKTSYFLISVTALKGTGSNGPGNGALSWNTFQLIEQKGRIEITTGAENQVTVLKGRVQDNLIWTNPVPTGFSICSALRFVSSSIAAKPVLRGGSTDRDIHFGHNAGNFGTVACPSDWIEWTESSSLPSGSRYTNWLVECVVSGRYSQTTGVLLDQTFVGSPTNTHGYPAITGLFISDADFEAHSVYIWDNELSTVEMQTVTAALRKELGGSAEVSNGMAADGPVVAIADLAAYKTQLNLVFSTDIITATCHPCPANSQTNEAEKTGLAACACVTGYYMTSGGCIACAIGATTLGTGATSRRECVCGSNTNQPACAAGYGFNFDECTPSTGVWTCEICGQGTYNNGAHAAACYSCPRGMTTSGPKSISADACVCKNGPLITEPNQQFLDLLKNKRPTGVNIFTDYDPSAGVIRDRAPDGQDYVPYTWAASREFPATTTRGVTWEDVDVNAGESAAVALGIKVVCSSTLSDVASRFPWSVGTAALHRCK